MFSYLLLFITFLLITLVSTLTQLTPQCSIGNFVQYQCSLNYARSEYWEDTSGGSTYSCSGDRVNVTADNIQLNYFGYPSAHTHLRQHSWSNVRFLTQPIDTFSSVILSFTVTSISGTISLCNTIGVSIAFTNDTTMDRYVYGYDSTGYFYGTRWSGTTTLFNIEWPSQCAVVDRPSTIKFIDVPVKLTGLYKVDVTDLIPNGFFGNMYSEKVMMVILYGGDAFINCDPSITIPYSSVVLDVV
eukprot:TRINITY_DN18112_c0_g1_i1.p1 TRINITY_DN18112_c0_g1~~TRINITY_DN18112_c0_g1_i1.p1  ORF type:complete len:243 (-),score=35.15 TRINITY_DN18112_c0_g1_i1:43-771(-)